MATKISPTLKTTANSDIITLAAGCFWGVERAFKRYFTGKGLIDIKVGYANGIANIGKVNYEQVCTGKTDFVESVQIAFDPSQTSLENILDIFFRIHDPTTLNSQGPDMGSQYRSAIMVHNEEQRKIAIAVRDRMQKDWYPSRKIVTSIEDIRVWYDAETYHQQYLDKNPGGYECPTHFLRTKPMI